ncbi:MAG TPA: hypothetical protein VLF61_04045 [Rhabdochlamydiaceae bacterium]|nr:hypothetical protein [Rhabdochlamydiaceae bacterium]
MKKRILLSITAVLLTSHFLMAECGQCLQIVPFSEFTEEAFIEFTQGKLDQVILECTEGTVFPFTVSVKGNFLEFTNKGSASVKVTQTIYAKCVESSKYLFSSDLDTWKPFKEFFTGKIQSSVSVEDDHPAAGIDIELNLR